VRQGRLYSTAQQGSRFGKERRRFLLLFRVAGGGVCQEGAADLIKGSPSWGRQGSGFRVLLG
jgi:hypothetical protein